MKKILSIFCAAAIVLSLAACSGKDNTEQNSTSVLDNAVPAGDSIPITLPVDAGSSSVAAAPQTDADSDDEAQQADTPDEDAVADGEEENTVEPDEQTAPSAKAVRAIKISEDGVNIRAEDNTDCEVYGWGYSGELYRLLKDDSQNGWYKIDYYDEPAFVSSDFAEIVEVDADDIDTSNGELEAEDGGVLPDNNRESEDGQTR